MGHEMKKMCASTFEIMKDFFLKIHISSTKTHMSTWVGYHFLSCRRQAAQLPPLPQLAWHR